MLIKKGSVGGDLRTSRLLFTAGVLKTTKSHSTKLGHIGP